MLFRSEDARPEYLAQLAAYAEALRAIEGNRAIRCEILWTAAPRRMAIPDELLRMAGLRGALAAT